MLADRPAPRGDPDQKTGLLIEFFLHSTPESSPASAPTPLGGVTFFLAKLPARCRLAPTTKPGARALGERRGIPSVDGPPAFFQDANYHDQIVNEQNKPAAMPCPDEGTPAQRSARDLPKASQPWTEVRTGCRVRRHVQPSRASTHDRRTHDRAGPHHAANLTIRGCDAATSYASEPEVVRPGSGDHEPFGSSLPNGHPRNSRSWGHRSRERHIGRRTPGKLAEPPTVVKRPCRFPHRRPFSAHFRRFAARRPS